MAVLYKGKRLPEWILYLAIIDKFKAYGLIDGHRWQVGLFEHDLQVDNKKYDNRNILLCC